MNWNINWVNNEEIRKYLATKYETAIPLVEWQETFYRIEDWKGDIFRVLIVGKNELKEIAELILGELLKEYETLEIGHELGLVVKLPELNDNHRLLRDVNLIDFVNRNFINDGYTYKDEINDTWWYWERKEV